MTSNSWYKEIIQDFNASSEEAGLTQKQADVMRSLLIDSCRQNYAKGNRSGIKWQREQTEALLTDGQVAKWEELDNDEERTLCMSFAGHLRGKLHA